MSSPIDLQRIRDAAKNTATSGNTAGSGINPFTGAVEAPAPPPPAPVAAPAPAPPPAPAPATPPPVTAPTPPPPPPKADTPTVVENADATLANERKAGGKKSTLFSGSYLGDGKQRVVSKEKTVKRPRSLF